MQSTKFPGVGEAVGCLLGRIVGATTAIEADIGTVKQAHIVNAATSNRISCCWFKFSKLTVCCTANFKEIGIGIEK